MTVAGDHLRRANRHHPRDRTCACNVMRALFGVVAVDAPGHAGVRNCARLVTFRCASTTHVLVLRVPSEAGCRSQGLGTGGGVQAPPALGLGTDHRKATGGKTVHRPWVLIVVLMGPVVGCSDAAAMSCEEFLDLSSDERSEAFESAVEARGVSFGGPDWQKDMRRATAESHCSQNRDDELGDALDFAGVPR